MQIYEGSLLDYRRPSTIRGGRVLRRAAVKYASVDQLNNLPISGVG